MKKDEQKTCYMRHTVCLRDNERRCAIAASTLQHLETHYTTQHTATHARDAGTEK